MTASSADISGRANRFTAAVVLLTLLTANLNSVKLFGEFEFWFSRIKVVMNILVIALGLGIINSVALRIAVFTSARSSHTLD